MSKNIAASIRQKLLNHAKSEIIPYDRVLKNYAIERLLYRLSISAYRDCFVLKGAQLLRAWHAVGFRPTKDVDLLGYFPNQPAEVESLIREILETITGNDDGLLFDCESVHGQLIQEDADYSGVRINLSARLGTALIPLQMDIGFHDMVYPAPETVFFPSLLAFPPVELRGYTRESVIAEKVEAMITLGEQNSRMKDFYDIRLLSREHSFLLPSLRRALEETFRRRNHEGLLKKPVLLNPEHPAMTQKQIQWAAFLRKNQIANVPENFKQVCAEIQGFLAPVLQPGQQTANHQWIPAEGWIPYHETIAFEGQPASG